MNFSFGYDLIYYFQKRVTLFVNLFIVFSFVCFWNQFIIDWGNGMNKESTNGKIVPNRVGTKSLVTGNWVFRKNFIFPLHNE